MPSFDTTTEPEADLDPAVAGASARQVLGAAALAVAGLWGEVRVLGRIVWAGLLALGRRALVAAVALGGLAGADDTRWGEDAVSRLARRAWRRALRLASTPSAAGTARRPLGWGQVFAVGVCAFALWTLCDAPTLLHSAEASPLGARRTAAVAVLRPFADVSRALGLSHVVSAADRLLGRSGSGVAQVVGPPARQGPRAPTRPAAATGVPVDAMPALPVPTAAAPLRVLSIGDSLGVDFGGPFVDDLAATGVVHAVLDAQIDTGLSRPDYFDWPAELQADLARDQPQVVVVFLGANDPQNFVEDGSALAYGTPAWIDAYGRRVGAFMQEATTAGARVLWVGMPPMADPVLDAEMQVLDGIYQSQAATHPGVTYLSSWPVLSDAQGAFTQYLPDASGNQVAVREPDGTHLSPAGAERLSQAVIEAMDRTWGLELAP